MLIEFIKRTPVQGTTHDKGATVEIEDALANRLIDAGYARASGEASPGEATTDDTAAEGRETTTSKRKTRTRRG